MTIVAVRAIASRAVLSAYALKRQASSFTKPLPAFPSGMAKMFRLQLTTSA